MSENEKALDAARDALLQPAGGGFVINLRAAILAYNAVLSLPEVEATPSQGEADTSGVREVMEAWRAFQPLAQVAFLWIDKPPRDGEEARYREAYWGVVSAAGKLRAALASDASASGVRWLHKKSGHVVTEIGRGFAQVSAHPIEEMSAVVIYEHGGNFWVRNAVEFDDGRFEPTPPATGASHDE